MDNYRAIGKIWKLPRAALLINRPSNRNYGNHKTLPSNRQSSPTEDTPIYEDTSRISQASLKSPKAYAKGDYGGNGINSKSRFGCRGDVMNTSLDRASSTTSGISSDGDIGINIYII